MKRLKLLQINNLERATAENVEQIMKTGSQLGLKHFLTEFLRSGGFAHDEWLFILYSARLIAWQVPIVLRVAYNWSHCAREKRPTGLLEEERLKQTISAWESVWQTFVKSCGGVYWMGNGIWIVRKICEKTKGIETEAYLHFLG